MFYLSVHKGAWSQFGQFFCFYSTWVPQVTVCHWLLCVNNFTFKVLDMIATKQCQWFYWFLIFTSKLKLQEIKNDLSTLNELCQCRYKALCRFTILNWDHNPNPIAISMHYCALLLMVNRFRNNQWWSNLVLCLVMVTGLGHLSFYDSIIYFSSFNSNLSHLKLALQWY